MPVVSDDFRAGNLTHWTAQLVPVSGLTPGIGTGSDGTDWWAEIAIPGGAVYDSWTGTDQMPRLVQDASGLGTSWTVTVKFVADPPGTTASQSQGIWIGGAAGHWLRWEQLARNGRRDLFCGRCAGGTASTEITVTSAGAAARWLRITRAGDTLSFYSSTDGATWTLRGTDTDYLGASTVSWIGFHGGRTGSAAGWTLRADCFEIDADPIAGEDEGAGGATEARSVACASTGAVAVGRIVTARRAGVVSSNTSVTAVVWKTRSRAVAPSAASGVSVAPRVVRARPVVLTALSAVTTLYAAIRVRTVSIAASSAVGVMANVRNRVLTGVAIAAASTVIAAGSVLRRRFVALEAKAAVGIAPRVIRRRAATAQAQALVAITVQTAGLVLRSAAVAGTSVVLLRPRRIWRRGMGLAATGACVARARILRPRAVVLTCTAAITVTRHTYAVRQVHVAASSHVVVPAAILGGGTRRHARIGTSRNGGALGPSRRTGTLVRTLS